MKKNNVYFNEFGQACLPRLPDSQEQRQLPFLITTILKNHFGFKENSHLVAHTYCEVDYFRKDPKEAHVSRIKS